MKPLKARAAVLATALLVGMTAGCAAPTVAIELSTAKTLQGHVLEVTRSVAEGDPAGALDGLADLELALNAAAADGNVSFARYQDILTALEDVRASVQALLESQDAPSAPPTGTTGRGDGDGGAGEAPPPTVPAPSPSSPAPTPTDPGSDDGNSGNGNGGNGNNGNGNGNGNQNPGGNGNPGDDDEGDGGTGGEDQPPATEVPTPPPGQRSTEAPS